MNSWIPQSDLNLSGNQFSVRKWENSLHGLLSHWCLLRGRCPALWVTAKRLTLPELATPQALHVEELAFQFSPHEDPLVFTELSGLQLP